MIKLHRILLTLFGCGKVKKAPGTLGSAVSVVLWFMVTKCLNDYQIAIFFQNIFWGVVLILALIYGSIATKPYLKGLGIHSKADHQSIVFDEFIGQVLALQIVFFTVYPNYFQDKILMIGHMALCFTLFRIFDITKPLFIGYFDRRIKSGFGIMLDDVLAGMVAGGIGYWIFKAAV